MRPGTGSSQRPRGARMPLNVRAQPPLSLGVPAHTDSAQVVWTAVRMGSGTPSLGPEPPGGLPRSQGQLLHGGGGGGKFRGFMMARYGVT